MGRKDKLLQASDTMFETGLSSPKSLVAVLVLLGSGRLMYGPAGLRR